MLLRKLGITLFFIMFGIVMLTLFLSSDLTPVVENEIQAASLQQVLPTISFARSALSVTEPGPGQTTALPIAVRISSAPAIDMEVTVQFATVNGSALAGVDYISTSGTLTFPVGSTDDQIFDVIILHNASFLPQRTFAAFLTNSVNAFVGDPAATIITIVNSDPTPTPTQEPLRNKQFFPIVFSSLMGCPCPAQTAVVTGTPTKVLATSTRTPWPTIYPSVTITKTITMTPYATNTPTPTRIGFR